MLKSAKFSWWDSLLRALLKILWEPFSRKQSYSWNWKPYSGEVECSIWIRKEEGAKNRNSLWRNIWQTNYGWKQVEVIAPLSDRTDAIQLNEADYYLGFYNEEKKINEICWLKLNGVTAVLKGDKLVNFFALNASNMESMQLWSIGITSKKEFRKWKDKTPLI